MKDSSNYKIPRTLKTDESRSISSVLPYFQVFSLFSCFILLIYISHVETVNMLKPIVKNCLLFFNLDLNVTSFRKKNTLIKMTESSQS